MSKIHRTKNGNLIKTYRMIPYEDFSEVLKQDGEAFLEDPEQGPLKRQTVWKAAKKLSKMVGKKVRFDRALFQLDDEAETRLEGYAFSVEEDQQSQSPEGTAS